MNKWEYKIIKFKIALQDASDFKEEKLQHTLNKHGAEGWEVINVFDLNMVEGKSSVVIVSLKRKLD